MTANIVGELSNKWYSKFTNFMEKLLRKKKELLTF